MTEVLILNQNEQVEEQIEDIEEQVEEQIEDIEEQVEEQIEDIQDDVQEVKELVVETSTKEDEIINELRGLRGDLQAWMNTITTPQPQNTMIAEPADENPLDQLEIIQMETENPQVEPVETTNIQQTKSRKRILSF